MKQRIKLNNKKSHFPLPLGEGRISTQGTSVRNSGEGKSFTKALSVAALAGLTFLGAQANAQGVNAEDNPSLTLEEGQITGAAADINWGELLSKREYGEGDAAKYYKWELNENTGAYNFVETAQSDAQITVKYSTDNLQNRFSTDVDYSSTNFEGTYLNQTTDIHGGALDVSDSTGKLGNINGYFIDNNIPTYSGYAYGGAIASYSSSTIGDINAIFAGNNVNSTRNSDYTGASGGAVNNINSAFINSINGAFIGNYLKGTGTAWVGGSAIYNVTNATIGDINADFIGNYSSVQNSSIYGTIINYSNGIIGDISGNFIGNSIFSHSNNNVYGSVIYNQTNSTIKDVKGNFLYNSSLSTTTSDTNGAILNLDSVINLIIGYFEGNSAESQGRASAGALNNNANATITEGVTADFVRNYAKGTVLARGGAVLNFGYTPHITGDFTENHAESSGTGAIGGALANITGSLSTLDKLEGDYTGNYALATGANGYAHGGAIYNTGTIGEISKSSFNNNYAKSEKGAAYGGAIYNTNALGEIVNSNFTNNYAKASNGEAKGGAIYTSKDVLITSKDGFETKFEGNYVQDKNGRRSEAIYVDNNATLTLNAKTNGKFTFNDQINGKEQYNLKLKGDSTGKVYFNNDVLNANIEHNDVTTYVDGMKFLNHAKGEGINSLTMNSGTLNVGSFNLAPLHFEKFAMNGGTINIDKVDVDLANKTMGRITANSYGGSDKGTINVKAMNVLSDGEKEITPVLFADKSFKNTVKSPVKEAYTKLYRYDVSYDANGKFGEDGYFVFTRGGNGRNSSDSFNPAVLTSPVATQAGAQASMTNTLYYAFEHGDTFMNFSAMDRFAKINSNTYALAERQGALSTDFNSNLNLDYAHQNKGIWTKPYSSFESIHLKNGPKVDVISYGTLIGFDSDIHKLKRGWANVATAYIGYNGSQVDYSNVDASTNGGLLGLTETFYKGNFWTALTATAGASFAEAHTMYGKDEMTMLMAGIGSKTGYNFEFKEGKFIIQPRLFMSYSFVNTFDYTNSAGVRIDSDPMHTVQINPSVKFIGNVKGWQPYASVGMVWNLLNETHTEANGVKLPEMHTKPYVEYGVGLQRTWADKFSAYGQAMLRHGGRNGVALTLGFRWALGRDYSRPQKVQKDSKMSARHDVKGVNDKQDMLKVRGQDGKMLKRVQHDNTLSHQNATVGEGNKKVLKQLSPTKKQKFNKTTRTTMSANVEKI